MFRSMSGSVPPCVNAEIIKSLQRLREEREELDREIMTEQVFQAETQTEVTSLNGILQKIGERVSQKKQLRSEYDRTIQETESAYAQIQESSQSLLCILRSDAVFLMDDEGSKPREKRRRIFGPSAAAVNQRLWNSGPLGQHMIEREAAEAGIPVEFMFRASV